MTRIKIKTIVWNDWNREHIKKHNVSVNEVEVTARDADKGERKKVYEREV